MLHVHSLQYKETLPATLASASSSTSRIRAWPRHRSCFFFPGGKDLTCEFYGNSPNDFLHLWERGSLYSLKSPLSFQKMVQNYFNYIYIHIHTHIYIFKLNHNSIPEYILLFLLTEMWKTQEKTQQVILRSSPDPSCTLRWSCCSSRSHCTGTGRRCDNSSTSDLSGYTSGYQVHAAVALAAKPSSSRKNLAGELHYRHL